MRHQARLPFELDQRSDVGAVTAHGGVPLVIEAFRTSGAAALPAPQTARDFLDAFDDEAAPSLWQGERCHLPGEGSQLTSTGTP